MTVTSVTSGPLRNGSASFYGNGLRGLAGSEEAARALRGLDGAWADVALAQLAFLVRKAGCDDAARVLERWRVIQ